MIIISHRGNLVGSEPQLENGPPQIKEAIKLGFDVEVDVWLKDGQFLLCHDLKKDTVYPVSYNFFVEHKKNLWLHAKNAEALFFFKSKGFNVFWHENDQFTLTNKGYIWTHVNNKANFYCKESIVLLFDKVPILDFDFKGICTDFPIYFQGLNHQYKNL